jgi:hypothetical protein
MPSATVSLRYTLNDGPPLLHTLDLDANGEILIDVPAVADKGVYRFLAFRRVGASEWTDTDVTITIR